METRSVGAIHFPIEEVFSIGGSYLLALGLEELSSTQGWLRQEGIKGCPICI